MLVILVSVGCLCFCCACVSFVCGREVFGFDFIDCSGLVFGFCFPFS